MTRHRIARLTTACAATLAFAIVGAAPAVAHDTSDRLAICPGWPIYSSCGIAEVTNGHTTITVGDTYRPDGTVFANFQMTSGRWRQVIDPDATGPGVGRYTEPTPSLDRIAQFQVCDTVRGCGRLYPA